MLASVVDPVGATVAAKETSFDYSFSVSPSIWIGYTAPNGLGAAVSWFRFDQRSNPVRVSEQPGGTSFQSLSGFLVDGSVGGPPGAGQTNDFNLITSLVLDTWDFDVTQRLALGQVDVIAGAGIRYLHMAQRFVGSVNQTGAGATDSALESAANSFSGIGPTVMIDAQRPIGLFNLSVYANARAGILFGSRHEGDFTASTAIPALVPFTVRTDQPVGFGEIELGVEWAGQFGRFLPFARLGFEGRDYFNTGNAQSIYLTHSSDVGLYGIAIHAGVGF